MAKQKMNVKLLRKVRDHILEEPLRYSQNIWLEKNVDSIKEHQGGKAPACGTMGCVAGWVCVLDGKNPRVDFQSAARKSLNLTPVQAARLFSGIEEDDYLDFVDFGRHWPENFAKAYNAAKTPRQRARVAADRIDHFIKTNGAE